MGYSYDLKTADFFLNYLKQQDLVGSKEDFSLKMLGLRKRFQNLEINPQLKQMVGKAMLTVDFKDLDGDWGNAKAKISQILGNLKKNSEVKDLDPKIEQELVKILEYKMVLGMNNFEAHEEREQAETDRYWSLIESFRELRLLYEEKIRENSENEYNRQLSNDLVATFKDEVVELSFTLDASSPEEIEDKLRQMAWMAARSGDNKGLNIGLREEEYLELRNIVNYEAMLNPKLDYSINLTSENGKTSPPFLSSGSRLMQVLQKNPEVGMEGITLGDQIGLLLRGLSNEEIWKGENDASTVRNDCTVAIAEKFNRGLSFPPYELKPGLKYGNDQSKKERLRDIKHALKMGQKVSSMDLNYFRENGRIVAQAKDKEFGMEAHCKAVVEQAKLLASPKSWPKSGKKREKIVRDAANLVFAKICCNDLENSHLKEILSIPTIQEELFTRLGVKIQEEKSLHNNEAKYQLLVNRVEKLGITLDSSRKMDTSPRPSPFDLR